MIVSDTPLREKLVLLLHEQFPTSYQKVGYADLNMYRQNQALPNVGRGLVRRAHPSSRANPAMFDLARHRHRTTRRADANENFARELMERFTMGVGNYTEDDVRRRPAPLRVGPSTTRRATLLQRLRPRRQ